MPQTKDIKYQIRFSKADFREAKEQAEKANLTLSAYIRMLIKLDKN